MDRNPTLVADAELPETSSGTDAEIIEEVLLEEISIDGMCGVY